MSNLSTQIIVGGRAEQALDAMMKTANAVRATAKIAGASAREQYESFQLSIKGIKEEQAASEASYRSKIENSARAQAAWQREKVAQWQTVDAEQAASRSKELAALKTDILARAETAATANARAYGDTLRMLGLECRAAAEAHQQLGEAVGFGSAKMGYASASVRTLEGHIGTNVRAVERFISETLGLAPVLQAAFPIVGAVALAGMLAELAKKAYDAYQNIFNLKDAIAGLDQAEITVTQRVKQENDRAEQSTEDYLTKTQGPEAGARQRQAYRGAQPLDLTSYFQQKEFTSLTDNVKANYENLYTTIAPKDIPERLRAIKREVHDLNQAIYTINSSGGMLVPKDVGGFGPGGKNPDAYYALRLHAATQIQKQIQAQADAFAKQQQAGAADIVSIHNQQVEEAQRKAQEAARAAQEAQRKADADHLRALQVEFDLRKSSMTMQPWESKTNYEQRMRLDQNAFWARHLKDFSGNSGEYKTVLESTQKPLAEYNQTDAEGRAALRKMLSNPGTPEAIFAGMGGDKDIQARLKAQDAAVAAEEQLSLKLRETAISQDLAHGALSRHDAAVQMAALHLESYHAALEKLRAEADQINRDQTLNEEQRRAKLIGVGSQVDLLGLNYGAQAAQDKFDVSQQTGAGAWKESLDQFVQQSRDTAAQVRDIWSSALSSVNEEIVKIISTRHNYGVRREFGNLGAGMFRNVAGAGLQKAEGSLLGAFGLGGGKVDGTEANPFHVVIAGSKHAIAGAGAGVTGMVKSAVSDAGGFLGKVGGFASSFLSGLGFADGGMPPVGMASLVGENGPELFVPKVAGTVMSSGTFGGATNHHSWNIDARGATDPAAVNQAVMRGIAKAMPHIAAATTQAQHNSNSRMPLSRRR